MTKIKPIKKNIDPLMRDGSKTSSFAPMPFPVSSFHEENDMLSATLLKKGEFSLLNGDLSGLYFFDMALKLDPTNPNLYYQQGLALLEYGVEAEKEKGLKLAVKRFKRATALYPNYFEAWFQWGYTLYLLGCRTDSFSYFLNAKEKYDAALRLKKYNKESDLYFDLYVNYGDLWVKLAQQSQEPFDLQSALYSYEKATTYQKQCDSEFWLKYGNAALQMGKRVLNTKFFIQAIHCYKNVLSESISSQEGWKQLGTSIHALYCYTHEEDHFAQANECFAISAQLHGESKDLWHAWALLLFDSANYVSDKNKLQLCIEKCHKGYLIDQKCPNILSLWIQSLALLGSWTDDLELIEEAQNKMQVLITISEKGEKTLYAEGMVFMAFGAYFTDPDYYYQATEKFQAGSAKDRTAHHFWYALAKSYLAAAELDQDGYSFQHACRFFARAIYLHANPNYHYHYGLCLAKYGEMIQDQILMEEAIQHFQYAIETQKNATYLHLDWMFAYASALDLMGEFVDGESYYTQSLEILQHILTINPDFPNLHHQLALVYSHYGQLSNSWNAFDRAFHHYRIAEQREKENDRIILDWGITLANFGDILSDHTKAEGFFCEAEYKMIQAAKLGNVHAYYSLACLYSLRSQPTRALQFLEKAYYFEGLPSLDEILEDDWLENLRDSPIFRDFLERINNSIVD